MADPAAVTTRKQSDTWRQLVMAHPDLTPGQKLLGLALAAHFNFKTSQLNPSAERLGMVTGQCRGSVDKQIVALRKAGLIIWVKKGFRASNGYTLLIPADGRELERNTELWAGIDNLEPSAGVGPDQPSTLGVTTLNPQSAQPCKPGGTNPCNNPRKNLRATPARCPTGAPGAHGLGKLGDDLLAKHGPDKFRAWFSDAQLRDGRLIAGSPMKANWIRDHYANDLKGLDVIDPDRAATLVAA